MVAERGSNDTIYSLVSALLLILLLHSRTKAININPFEHEGVNSDTSSWSIYQIMRPILGKRNRVIIKEWGKDRICLLLEPYQHFFAMSAHSSIIMLNIDFIFILI